MLNTADGIMAEIENDVLTEANLAPSKWIDKVMRLTAVMGDKSKDLFITQQKLAKMQADLIESGKSVAFSEVATRGTDLWVHMKVQEAGINRIEEMVRLAKLRARIDSSEMHIGA